MRGGRLRRAAAAAATVLLATSGRRELEGFAAKGYDCVSICIGLMTVHVVLIDRPFSNVMQRERARIVCAVFPNLAMWFDIITGA